MLYPTHDRVLHDVLPASRSEDGAPQGDGVTHENAMAEAVHNLRALIMAGERYRMSVAGSGGLGTTESQAISYLAVHGARGQSELAGDLSLTSSAATALVDRLERHGAAERARHPSDRRRTVIRLTSRGEELAAAGQQPLLASLGLVESADLRLVSSWLGVIAGDLLKRTR
jgi:DNA-binding MarR family transcriptional regulator